MYQAETVFHISCEMSKNVFEVFYFQEIIIKQYFRATVQKVKKTNQFEAMHYTEDISHISNSEMKVCLIVYFYCYIIIKH